MTRDSLCNHYATRNVTPQFPLAFRKGPCLPESWSVTLRGGNWGVTLRVAQLLHIASRIIFGHLWVRRSSPIAGSRVSILVTPYGFRGGRNGAWIGFLMLSPCHKFHSTISYLSSHLFHFIRPYDDASGVVGRHPFYSQIFNKGASSPVIPRPGPVSNMSWGYLFIYNLAIYKQTEWLTGIKC